MIRIFVESGEISARKNGKKTTNEVDFLVKFIECHFPTKHNGLDFMVQGLGGKDTLEQSAPVLRDKDSSDIDIIVFDADLPQNGGGFSTRKKHIEEERHRLMLKFDLFLWPNNHDDGDFETLLERMINPKHQGVLDCFKGFQMCVGGMDPCGDMYQLPGAKAEMYTYIELMKLSDDERDMLHRGFYQFDNPEYWDLYSPYADALLTFLKKYFRA